jgi:uncharacterized lipoprotein YehR (DUF1307 family)
MSDYNSSLPVRTENDGDIVVKVGDASLPSQQLGVDSSGRVTVKIQDSSGDNLESTSGALHVTTAGQPIEVSATDLDIRDLVFATDKVDVSGSEVSLDSATLAALENITVSATDLDIRDLAFATDKVDVSGSEVSLDSATLAALENITVSATDLDIRDLAFATDKVDVSGSEVSLDSATLAALENINAVVTATDLDIRDLAFATDKVDVSGSEVSLDSATLAALENITVSATDLDIRDLSHAQDSVKVGDGTDFLAVNTDGSINVVMQEDAGLEVVDYNTTSSLAASSSSNHDYTTGAAAKLYQVLASASGKMKVELQVETAAASGTFVTKAVAFNSTATPNIDLDLRKYVPVVSGAKIRVIRTNLDNQAQNVYSTIVAIQG